MIKSGVAKICINDMESYALMTLLALQKQMVNFSQTLSRKKTSGIMSLGRVLLTRRKNTKNMKMTGRESFSVGSGCTERNT